LGGAGDQASDFEGAVVIVTGGGRNLGREYCRAFAQRGGHVVVADIADTEEAVDELTALGAKAVGVHVDVADEASVAEMVSVAMTFGRIDVLVNNAALYGDLVRAPLEELGREDFERTMTVNVTGPFLCTKAVWPVMRRQGGGSIVNISSGTFWVGMGSAHYVASKGAVIGLTRVAAREGGPLNIRCNAITPGFTMSQASIDVMGPNTRLADRIAAATPLGRLEQPADLVGTVLFLASQASAFMTGQTLNVDGGWYMH